MLGIALFEIFGYSDIHSTGDLIFWLMLLWLIKWLLQGLQIALICNRVGEKAPQWHWHVLYELYLTLITLGTAIFFASPKKTVWKGRKY
jgi:hypothetical protein